MADIVVLRSGKSVEGEIILHNEEVVIVRDVSGMRHQYPSSEVVRVSTQAESTSASATVEAENTTREKKVSFSLEVAGGGACVPKDCCGGNFSLDLLLGSFQIADKHIFLGGGLGYRAIFAGKTYSYLPLEAVVRVPMLEGKHAPYAGAALGYGFAANKAYKGGLSAGIDLGYRYASSAKSALLVALYASFQQTQLATTETIEYPDLPPQEFNQFAGRSWVLFGLKAAVQF